MPHYVITQSMPGYMPESEPFVISGTLADAIAAIHDEVDRAADAEAYSVTLPEDSQDWDSLLDEIERDRDNAANLDDRGVTYYAPDGRLVWEATRYGDAELRELGYVPGEDYEPADA